MLFRTRRRFFSKMVSANWSAAELATGEQTLPFVIRRVTTADEFEAVLAQRVSGYRLGDWRKAVDEADFADNGVVLAAFDKSGGACLGSIRLVLGDRGPNEITDFVRFEPPWRDMTKIEARRYVVPRSVHSMKVKVLLMKALYRVAEQEGIEAIVATSAEGLATTYRMMHFEDLAPGGLTVLPSGARKPVCVVAIEVARLRGLWRSDPALRNFYRVWFEQTHPDLDLSDLGGPNPLRFAVGRGAAARLALPLPAV